MDEAWGRKKEKKKHRSGLDVGWWKRVKGTSITSQKKKKKKKRVRTCTDTEIAACTMTVVVGRSTSLESAGTDAVEGGARLGVMVLGRSRSRRGEGHMVLVGGHISPGRVQ